MTDTRLTAGGREGWLLPRKKKRGGGREYKEVSRLAEIASQRREEKETLIVFADCFDLQSDRFSVEKPSLLALPRLEHRVSRDATAGRSVGGIRVNTARAFCRGGHWWRGSSILPTSISTDALRTVHLTGCESVTVSSCLADNMAKGIHQLSWELRVS